MEKRQRAPIPLFPQTFPDLDTSQLRQKSYLALSNFSPVLAVNGGKLQKVLLLCNPSFLIHVSFSRHKSYLKHYLHQDFLSCIWALLKRMCIGLDIETSWEIPEGLLIILVVLV